MHDITLRQLRALRATAHEGTIAAAARVLHVTAPAVGQQLRLLEKLVGLPLLERTEHGFRPTSAGVELLESAERIDAELTRCAEVIELHRGAGVGHIRFGAVSTAKYFAPHLLASFWREHPDIEVDLLIGNRAETIARVTEREVDLVIMGRPPEDLEMEAAEIAEHPHVIIAAPDHPLVGRRVTMRALRDERFLLREPGSGTRSLTERVFAELDHEPTIGMEIQSNETIKQAAMAGLGIALISAHTIAAEVTDGRLAVLDVAGLPLVRHWRVMRRAGTPLLPAGAALWDFLVDEGHEHLPATPAPTSI